MSNSNLYTRQQSLNLSIPKKVVLYVPSDVLFIGDFALTTTDLIDANILNNANQSAPLILKDELEKSLDLYLKEYCKEAFDKYMLYLEKLIIKLRTIGVGEVVVAFPDTNEYLTEFNLTFNKTRLTIDTNISKNLNGKFSVRGLTLNDIKSYINFADENFLFSNNFNEVPQVLKRLTHPYSRFTDFSGINFNSLNINFGHIFTNYVDSSHRLDFKRSFDSISNIELDEETILISLHDDTLFKSFHIDCEETYNALLSENLEIGGYVYNTEYKTCIYLSETDITDYKIKTFKAVKNPKIKKSEPLWDSMSYPFLTNFDFSSSFNLANAIYQSEFEFSEFIKTRFDYLNKSEVANDNLLRQFMFFNCNESNLLSFPLEESKLNLIPINLKGITGRFIKFEVKENIPLHTNLELLKGVGEDILVDLLCRSDQYTAETLYSARGFMDMVVIKSIDTLGIKPSRTRKPEFI